MKFASSKVVAQLLCKILLWLNLAELEWAKLTPKLNVSSLL